tara:strand:+ start:18496 stop:18876 length:381 start_codon:yes stop_codon:yes gene_type:complete
MEFLKHISRETLKEYNPNKSYALTDKEVSGIWNAVILSDDSTLVDLRLIKAENILNSIYLKAATIKDDEKKKANLENIEELRGILNEAKDIIKINRIQASLLNKANLSAFAMKKEINKLNEVIDFK